MLKMNCAKCKNAFIYIGLTVVLCILLSLKKDYHIDELLTYNLANYYEWFEPDNGVTYAPAEKVFIEQMTSDGTFDLEHIWKQQSNDVHPPFYYLIVYLVCFFFPNTISMRYAGIVNIIFLNLTLLFFRKLLGCLLDDEKIINVISIVFCLSGGILSIATFLRMYVMVMFFVTAITYIIINSLEKYDLKTLAMAFILTVGGTLTHYYFIVYLFFLSLGILFILLRHNRLKETFLYIVTMAVSGVVSVAIFPPIIRQLFFEKRGAESVENFINITDFSERIDSFLNVINIKLFGGLLGFLIILIVILFLIDLIKLDSDSRLCHISTEMAEKYLCIFVAVSGFFMIISKTAPYDTDRYISPIYAVVLALVFGIIYNCFKNVFSKTIYRNRIYSILLLFVIALSLIKCDWYYLFSGNEEKIEDAIVYGKGAEAIVIYDDSLDVLAYYMELIQCETVTFYKDSDIKLILRDHLEKMSDKVVLYVLCDNPNIYLTEFANYFNDYKIVCDTDDVIYYYQKN